MATPQTFGPQPFDKKKYLLEHFSPEEADALLAGATPNFKGTLKQAPLPTPNQPPVKQGAGMAQKGIAVNPDSYESLKAAGQTPDAIADQMAQSSPHFATQLGKIRKKFAGDPSATEAFLNTRFYGDTQYNPVSSTTTSWGEEKPKNYVAKTLDRVFQSAYNVLGEGGVMQQYNRGEISGPQAVQRTAGQVYHGALTPALDVSYDVGKGILDATGGTQAIQYGVEGIANSEFGQQAAPYVKGAIEGYQNLPQDSGWRDLASIGQVGLDTLGVIGAQSSLDVGKRAIVQGATHPLQTIRHPIQSAKQVWTGKGKVTLPPNAETKLAGPAQQAVKSGLDEKLVQFASDQSPDTRAVMAKMTRAAHDGGKVLGGTTKHKEILGGQVMDNLAYILDEKAIVGKALGAMKASVADDVFDLTEDYVAFLKELRNKGAVINDKGVITSLAAAADDNIPLLQKTLDFLMPDETGIVAKKGLAIDQWRQKMFQEMNSAKARLQPSANGKSVFDFAENLTNKVRRDSFLRMSRGNKYMVVANDAFEELSTQASKFLKSIGYKGSLDPDAITSKQLRAGEVALRTLGNASADTRDAFTSLIETAKKHGRISNIDEMALIRYADALEDLFPITPTRSLQGAVSRGTKDALGNFTEDVVRGGAKSGIFRAGADAVIGQIDRMRGITPENRLKLLLEILDAPPETPLFNIIDKVLPDEVADDLEQVSKGLNAEDLANDALDELDNLTPEERATGIMGGGGDNMPRTQAQKSVNGGSIPEMDLATQKQALNQAVDEASDVVQQFTKSLNGAPITDDISKLPAFKTAKANYNKAFAALQDFNLKNKDFNKANRRVYPATPSPKGLPREGATTGNLAEEAKKYKSADEFANSMMYHGTLKDNIPSILKEGLVGSRGRVGKYKGNAVKYVSFADDPNNALSFASGRGGEAGMVISPKPKSIYDLGDIRSGASKTTEASEFISKFGNNELYWGQSEAKKWLQEKGYDAISFKNPDNIVEIRVLGDVKNVFDVPEGFLVTTDSQFMGKPSQLFSINKEALKDFYNLTNRINEAQ